MAAPAFPPASFASTQPQSFGGPDVVAKFDLSELLPPAAGEKLRLLRVRSEEAHAVVPPFSDIQQASIAKIEAANRLKRLIDPAGIGGFSLPHDQPQVVAAERALEKAADEFQKLTDRSETRTKAWQAASAALQSVELWLRDGKPPSTAVEDFEAAEVKLSKGETLLEAIERHRRRASELRADVARVQSAPYPSAYAKERMRQEVEQLARRGAPLVARLVEMNEPIDWPTHQLRTQVHNTNTPAIGFTETVNSLALVAWLHRDALVAKLDREVDAASDDVAALSIEERQRREAEVMEALLATERDESALTWQAQTQGLPVEHRGDCSPIALLGLRLLSKAQREAPGTSWMHSFTKTMAGGGRR